MKKEDFTALGLSEELAVKASEASQKELEGYVAKTDYDTVTAAKDQLEKDIKERDGQLENLKKSGKGGEGLNKKIEELQEENRLAKETYEKEMKELKLSTAIKLSVGSTAHDPDLVASLVDKEKLVMTDDGKVAGLEEQVKALKDPKAFLFKTEDPGSGQGHEGGKPSAGYKPKAGQTNEGSIGKSLAEAMNKTAEAADNPYAKAWG